MTGLRVSCCVPFCKRSRGDWRDDPVTADMEWICANHWRALPSRRRRLYSTIHKRANEEPAEQFQWKRLAAWLWPRLKAFVIEHTLVGPNQAGLDPKRTPRWGTKRH